MEAIGRQFSAVSFQTGREKRTRRPLKRGGADVVLDAGDEVCLYGVPAPAEPVHRRSFRILDAFSCLHVIITNNRTEVMINVK